MTDSVKNFAISAVATAPSTPTAGTSLVVTTGDGAKFPTVFPFNATISQSGVVPTAANSEVVQVTGISTDTLTIVRAQEGTAARTVVVGDQIAQTVTAKTVTDLMGSSYNAEDHGLVGWSFDPIIASSAYIPATGRIYYWRVKVRKTSAITNVLLYCSTAGATITSVFVAVYTLAGVQLGTTSSNQSVPFASTGLKTTALGSATATIAAGTEVIVAYLAVATTAPTLSSTAALTVQNVNLTTTSPFRAALSTATGQTALPASITPSGYGSDGHIPWVGLS